MTQHEFMKKHYGDMKKIVYVDVEHRQGMEPSYGIMTFNRNDALRNAISAYRFLSTKDKQNTYVTLEGYEVDFHRGNRQVDYMMIGDEDEYPEDESDDTARFDHVEYWGTDEDRFDHVEY